MKLAVAAASAAIVLSALPGHAVAVDSRPAGPRIEKATIKASATVVTEGDRVTLTVRVPKSKHAKRVVLQERYVDVLSSVYWRDITSKRAKRRVTFAQTVTAKNEADYRVAVSYRGRAKAVVSKPLRLTVWRWIELSEFPAYHVTSSLITHGQDQMAGSAYKTLGLHHSISTPRSWEVRVTPGRNCTRLRAVLGLSDRSADGSTGTVSLSTDESTVVYQSPSLVPGTVVPVEVALDRPYRFGIAAANTSAGTLNAYPMVGNGAFYCTGIDD